MKININTTINTAMNTSLCMMLCVLSLFGCSATRSDYQQPALTIPGSWYPTSLQAVNVQSQSDHTKQSGIVERPDKWWTLFEDAQLTTLVEKVLSSNDNLAKATLSLKKARLEAGLSENSKIPILSFLQNTSFEYASDGGSSETRFDSSLSLNYELDLWGRVDALVDVDEWAAKASYEDREFIAQNLVVTAATLYWKIAYLNQMLTLTKQNLTGTEEVAKLTEHKYKVGDTTRLDVLESKQVQFNQQVQLNQLQQELSESNNAMSVLLNVPLQDTGIKIDQLSTQKMPNIESGIPSELLLRKPDVRAALYTLKSSLASKDALKASYMPTLVLTGALSTSSSDLLALLQNPVAKLGSGLILPFLEWNKMALNKNMSEVDYQMVVIDYRMTIYQALGEVANLLAAKNHYFDLGN